MNRIILINIHPVETTLLKAVLRKDPEMEVSVAAGAEQVKYYLDLWGGIDLILCGCGLIDSPENVSLTFNIYEELKHFWPDLEVILVSYNRDLMDKVKRMIPAQIKDSIDLSPETKTPEEEILKKINDLVAAVKAARPRGVIPGVLLVDDEENVLRTLALVLKTGGFTKVFTAGDPDAALKIFKENLSDINVCLIDYNLAGVTAEKLIYNINRLAPRAKIFVVSGEGKSQQKLWPEKMIKICSGFLGKPFDIGEIVLAIDEALVNEVVYVPQRQKKILVIDDSPETARMLEGILGDEFMIIKAVDGEIGLEKFRETEPDLVILDYKLPKKNGLEVMRDLNALSSGRGKGRPPLKVVVVTIESDPSIYTKFMGLGVEGFIYKPIKSEEIEKIIRLQLKD